MCFDYDAVPPDLPADLAMPRLAGGAAAEDLTLTSADGTAVAAAFAEAPEPVAGGPAVVIYPDVRGLYDFYRRLAERFAEAGHHAIVLDYFGRTAGAESRGEDFDFWPNTLAVEAPNVQADTQAAIAAVRERTGATAFVIVGFCFGGTNAFLSATNGDLGLSGVVGFYGGLDPDKHGMKVPSPVASAAATKVPVLALFGGADESIPQERRDAFEAGLQQAGVEHEVHVYEGAPHSFFDRSFAEHAEACDDAWRRVIGFLRAHGG